MSWMKRPQTGDTPASGAQHPPYVASQPSYGNEQNVFPNYSVNTPGNPNSQQQQYWLMQTPQPYTQQYGQTYHHQDFGSNNANQFYQQNNQSYGDQSLPPVQHNYQQNYSHFNQNQPTNQQNYSQNKQNQVGWEDNWDWGWDENAKQGQNSTQQISTVVQSSIPQQNYNNANVIEESFVSNDSWNWTMNDQKEMKEVIAAPLAEPVETEKIKEHNTFSEQVQISENQSVSAHKKERARANEPDQAFTAEEMNVKTLNDRDIIKEKMPNLALGKRFHLDNLTPQWSIESQMSQESSDGPQTQSESTYRSGNHSRNSNKSSPGLNTDNSSFNYSQANVDDFSKNTSGDLIIKTDFPQKDITESQNSQEDLAASLQEMNLTNRENITPESARSSDDFLSMNIQDSMESMPIAPSSGAFIPPPANFPPVSTTQNPFQHAGSFSHKSAVKSSSSNTALINQIFAPSVSNEIMNPSSNTNLTSPSVINKISHQYNKVASCYPTANLETTPDNSERPDHPQLSNFRSMSVPQAIPENLEVAPKNDRNEYLQTAHLSSGDYGENTDFTRDTPPIGLRRLVVGQQEGEYSQNLNADEPPPGLARMVPGQQNETDNTYNQPNDDYLGRHIDGQPMESTGRNSYRQADGQQTHSNYVPSTTSRSCERRPIGLDRMVPGEPSTDDYSRGQQYSSTNYSASSEHRVVTGVDYDYVQMPQEINTTSDVREQNVDGSDYMEHTPRNTTRNVLGCREGPSEILGDYNVHNATVVSELDQQREITVEGENLQDLSIISSTELSFSRDQPLDGADTNVVDLVMDRKTDLSDSIDLPTTSSRRHSLNRMNTSGEDSERDKTFQISPKRDRDKHKSSRDRDLRHSREERKYDRDVDRRSARDRDERDRRSEKERREKDRDRRDYKDNHDSPDDRRYRRSNRNHRYETEDTDYYSDRERERRKYREGSYTSSRPPRPDDKDRRYRDDKDKNRRYATIEREHRYNLDSEKYVGSRSRRSDRDRGRDDVHRTYDDKRYRDIDPERKYGNIRREKEERRRGSSGGGEVRGEPTEDELADGERPRHDRPRRHRRDRHYDPYYEGYGAAYADPYMLQRQQQQTFQYYEHLRLSNPAAYMEIYKKLMAGQPLPPAGSLITPGGTVDPTRGTAYLEGYGSLGYEMRGEERGSVHSGRSSANGLTGKDTDFTTDASLNLQLDDSVRSERMTPLKFSTAHVKGNLSSRHLVVVRASYGRTLDGRPAAVHVVRLTAALTDDPQARELEAYPGPLIKGVTHKKSVIEYCETRVRSAERHAGHDLAGYVLIWEMLTLLLRQNGTVVGSDIAELLMQNIRDYEYGPLHKQSHNECSSHGSAASSTTSRSELRHDLDLSSPAANPTAEKEDGSGARSTRSSSKERLDGLRELLIYGNRHQALEWAMSNDQWGHAMALAAWGDRRTRAAVAARFLAAQPPTDPLHTLYAALAGRQPPVATCVADERWGDWRPHLAVLLANASSKPDLDKRTITQLGDSLASRGLVYSAQFCYLVAGVDWCRHPLAPFAPTPVPAHPAPRLALLLAPPDALRLQQFATNQAIFATEIYEYARSLRDADYVITEFQVYKLVVASRLVDCGRDGRALAYAEAAARAVSRDAHQYSPRFITQLAEFADRLKYHEDVLHEDPPLLEEGGECETSPRHLQWLDDIKAIANAQRVQPESLPPADQSTYAPQYTWTPEQTVNQYPESLQPLQTEPLKYAADQPPAPPVPITQPEHNFDYTGQYYTQSEEQSGPYAGDWYAPDGASASVDQPAPYGYHEVGADEPAEAPRPQITMPGAGAPRAALFHDYDEPAEVAPHGEGREAETVSKQSQTKKEEHSKRKEEGGKGGGGAGAKSGWLGGILTKLALRPPNQMILPDDKNPRIVWDEDNKRWMDLDADSLEVDAPPPPPPTAMPMRPSGGPGAPAPPLTPTSNIFKMQKSRHIKKSYVDVFNPGGAATRPMPPASELLGAGLPAAPASYFVPTPADQSANYEASQLTTDEPYHPSM